MMYMNVHDIWEERKRAAVAASRAERCANYYKQPGRDTVNVQKLMSTLVKKKPKASANMDKDNLSNPEGNDSGRSDENPNVTEDSVNGEPVPNENIVSTLKKKSGAITALDNDHPQNSTSKDDNESKVKHGVIKKTGNISGPQYGHTMKNKSEPNKSVCNDRRGNDYEQARRAVHAVVHCHPDTNKTENRNRRSLRRSFEHMKIRYTSRNRNGRSKKIQLGVLEPIFEEDDERERTVKDSEVASVFNWPTHAAENLEYMMMPLSKPDKCTPPDMRGDNCVASSSSEHQYENISEPAKRSVAKEPDYLEPISVATVKSKRTASSKKDENPLPSTSYIDYDNPQPSTSRANGYENIEKYYKKSEPDYLDILPDPAMVQKPKLASAAEKQACFAVSKWPEDAQRQVSHPSIFGFPEVCNVKKSLCCGLLKIFRRDESPDSEIYYPKRKNTKKTSRKVPTARTVTAARTYRRPRSAERLRKDSR